MRTAIVTLLLLPACMIAPGRPVAGDANDDGAPPACLTAGSESLAIAQIVPIAGHDALIRAGIDGSRGEVLFYTASGTFDATCPNHVVPLSGTITGVAAVELDETSSQLMVLVSTEAGLEVRAISLATYTEREMIVRNSGFGLDPISSADGVEHPAFVARGTSGQIWFGAGTRYAIAVTDFSGTGTVVAQDALQMPALQGNPVYSAVPIHVAGEEFALQSIDRYFAAYSGGVPVISSATHYAMDPNCMATDPNCSGQIAHRSYAEPPLVYGTVVGYTVTRTSGTVRALYDNDDVHWAQRRFDAPARVIDAAVGQLTGAPAHELAVVDAQPTLRVFVDSVDGVYHPDSQADPMTVSIAAGYTHVVIGDLGAGRRVYVFDDQLHAALCFLAAPSSLIGC